MGFEPMFPGFESRESNEYFFLFIYFSLVYFFYVFVLSLLLQGKFANLTLLSLLRFSYFITPYDAQASSAFSSLIISPMTTKSGVFTHEFATHENTAFVAHSVK